MKKFLLIFAVLAVSFWVVSSYAADAPRGMRSSDIRIMPGIDSQSVNKGYNWNSSSQKLYVSFICSKVNKAGKISVKRAGSNNPNWNLEMTDNVGTPVKSDSNQSLTNLNNNMKIGVQNFCARPANTQMKPRVR